MPQKIDEKPNSNELIECFVIMPISSQPNYDDDHFTLVYEDIIAPAIRANSMEPYRGDDSKNTNLIQLDILNRVIKTPIAVCDMSAKNPNVFFELGMRQAFDLPTVLLIDDATDAPFDVGALRYVNYRKEMKHRDVKLATKHLAEAIKTTWEKRDDHSEVNSLIRLLELTEPAKLNLPDMSDQERIHKLTNLQINEIFDRLSDMQVQQAAVTNMVYAMQQVSAATVQQPQGKNFMPQKPATDLLPPQQTPKPSKSGFGVIKKAKRVSSAPPPPTRP